MENRGPFVVVSAIGDTVEDEIVDGLVLMDGENLLREFSSIDLPLGK